MKGVSYLQYLGRTLNHTDNVCLELQCNKGKEWAVWCRLIKMMRQEGVDNQVSYLLYRAVIHKVLLFGADYCALSGAMISTVDSTHMEFLLQITTKREIWQDGGS